MAKVKLTRTVTQEVELPDQVMGIVEGFLHDREVGMTTSTSGHSERVFEPIGYDEIISLVVDICEVYEKDRRHPRKVLRD